jgi:hypothetical protein
MRKHIKEKYGLKCGIWKRLLNHDLERLKASWYNERMAMHALAMLMYAPALPQGSVH